VGAAFLLTTGLFPQIEALTMFIDYYRNNILSFPFPLIKAV
jgi:hypothetical protein